MAEVVIGKEIKEEKVKYFLGQRNCGAPSHVLRYFGEVEVREDEGEESKECLQKGRGHLALKMPAGRKRMKRSCEKKNIRMKIRM